MDFLREPDSLHALAPNPRGLTPDRCNISSLLILPESELDQLLSITTRFLMGKKGRTQLMCARNCLATFGVFLRSPISNYKGSFPRDFNSWQFMVLQFGLWYISNPRSKAKLETDCVRWASGVSPWLAFLQEEGLIPFGVVLPEMRISKEVNGSTDTRLLGEGIKRPLNEKYKITKPTDNTFAGPMFWQTDFEFLNAYEDKLRMRDVALSDALRDYWARLARDYRTGRKLLRRITESDWMQKEDCSWRIPLNTSQQGYLVSPSQVDSHIWALRFWMHEILTSDQPDCLSKDSLTIHSAVPNGFLKSYDATPVKALWNLSALTKTQCDNLTSRQIFNRFTGIFNSLDYSVAVAILIREHPNFNPTSLAGAKLLNSRGKSYLILNGEDGEGQIFSVDKPRAKARKYAVLTRTARHVIRHIIRATKPVRDLLRGADSPHWRYLFLGDTGSGLLGHPRRINAGLLSGKTRSKINLPYQYPSLAEAGLGPGTLDFSRIRVTQGLLKWFDTGSITAVAKRLGNTEKTVLSNYIPPALVSAWNERIIRRFQNTLIALASHEEEWALDVVDMPNVAALNRFLAQLVCEIPSGMSPIGDKIQECFGSRFRIDQGIDNVSSHRTYHQLQVRLSPNSFALLMAYREWAQGNLSKAVQTTVDRETGIAPSYFIELAGMLQAAAEVVEVGDHLRESLDIGRLRRCYKQAIPLIPKLAARINEFSLELTLGD